MHHIHRPRALRPVPNFFHWTYARTGWICCCLFTKNIINFAFRFKLVYVCHHRGLKWSYASHSGGDTRYTITVLENTVRGSRNHGVINVLIIIIIIVMDFLLVCRREMSLFGARWRLAACLLRWSDALCRLFGRIYTMANVAVMAIRVNHTAGRNKGPVYSWQ